MGNPNPRTDQLKDFEPGHEKVGGREEGTPNKLKPDDVMSIVQDCLLNNMTFQDLLGRSQTKSGILWMIEGWIKKVAKKGDAKGMELLLRIFGLLKDNVNLSGELKTDIPTDQIFKDLGALADSVRDRTTTDDSATSKV